MSFVIRFHRPKQPNLFHNEKSPEQPVFVKEITQAKVYPTLNDCLEGVAKIHDTELHGDPMEITLWMLHKLKLCSVAVELMLEGILFNTWQSKTKIEVVNLANPGRPVHSFKLKMETE